MSATACTSADQLDLSTTPAIQIAPYTLCPIIMLIGAYTNWRFSPQRPLQRERSLPLITWMKTTIVLFQRRERMNWRRKEGTGPQRASVAQESVGGTFLLEAGQELEEEIEGFSPDIHLPVVQSVVSGLTFKV